MVKGIIRPTPIRVIQSCRPSFGTHMSNNSVGVSYTRRLFFSPAQSYHTDFFQNEKKRSQQLLPIKRNEMMMWIQFNVPIGTYRHNKKKRWSR